MEVIAWPVGHVLKAIHAKPETIKKSPVKISTGL
jgi:hypothetical protein